MAPWAWRGKALRPVGMVLLMSLHFNSCPAWCETRWGNRPPVPGIPGTWGYGCGPLTLSDGGVSVELDKY